MGEIAGSIAINGGQVALVGRSVERLKRTQEDIQNEGSKAEIFVS
ncbi:MAG: hypothetical protein ABSF82_02695 [Candidatus Bathyarchaeia archaeon]